MRVHPSILNSYGSRWQFSVAIVLLLLILGATLLRGNNKEAGALIPSVEMRDVLVVSTPLQLGMPITYEGLAIESRPVTTLPADVVTSFEEIEGKVAAGPIPAGYPLAKALLLGTDQLAPDEPEQSEEPQVVDPVDVQLASIRSQTVATSVSFKTIAPERGTRIALSIQRMNSSPAVVAEEAWVERSSNNAAQIRVSPAIALFLEEVKSLGQFSYFEIPTEGPSPFLGRGVSDINDLRVRLNLQSAEVEKERAQALAKKQAEREVLLPGDFTSYGWSDASQDRYAIGKDEKMYVISSKGIVTPLFERNLNLPAQMYLRPKTDPESGFFENFGTETEPESLNN